MMKKLIFVGVLVLAMSSLALAQDFPRFEIFGGYSYLRSDLKAGDYYDSYSNFSGNMNGFEGAFTYNLNSWVGIKTDVSGHFGKNKADYSYGYEQDYEDSNGNDYNDYSNRTTQKGDATVHAYTVMFGPEFSYRGNSKVRPFAHVLFGFSKVDVSKIDVDWTQVWGYSDQTEYRETGNVTGSFSNTGFAMALGGGLDINVSDRFAIRLAQIDYIPTWREIKATTTNAWEYYQNEIPQYSYVRTETYQAPTMRFNNLRMSAGVVIKLP